MSIFGVWGRNSKVFEEGGGKNSKDQGGGKEFKGHSIIYTPGPKINRNPPLVEAVFMKRWQ